MLIINNHNKHPQHHIGKSSWSIRLMLRDWCSATEQDSTINMHDTTYNDNNKHQQHHIGSLSWSIRLSFSSTAELSGNTYMCECVCMYTFGNTYVYVCMCVYICITSWQAHPWILPTLHCVWIHTHTQTHTHRHTHYPFGLFCVGGNGYV